MKADSGDAGKDLRRLIARQLLAVEEVLATSEGIVQYAADVAGGDGLKDVTGNIRAVRAAFANTAARPLAVPSTSSALDHSERKPPVSVAISSQQTSRFAAVSAGESNEPLLQSGEVNGSAPSRPIPARAKDAVKDKVSYLFADVEKVKEGLKQALQHDGFEVEDLYHKSGWAQAVARSDLFKNLTFVMIFLSSIWIAVDTDLNKPDAPPSTQMLFHIADNFVCVYFTFEIAVRLAAFAQPCDAFKTNGFNFDLILVGFMALDTWLLPLGQMVFQGPGASSSGMGHLRILRLVRLMRLARVGRLVRACPDLAVLVRGMSMALRAVFSTICLLMVVIYIFAVGFVQMLGDSEDSKECFGTVPRGMNCLLMSGVFPDQESLIITMLRTHWVYYVSLLAYFTLACFTVLNMLIGVVINVITGVAEAEAEARIVIGVEHQIREAMNYIDTDNNNRVSVEEFRLLIDNQHVVQSMAEVGVDVFALAECGDFVFHKAPNLSFEDFMQHVLMFRSSNTCTVKDAVDIRMFMLHHMTAMEERLSAQLTHSEVPARLMDHPSHNGTHGR